MCVHKQKGKFYKAHCIQTTYSVSRSDLKLAVQKERDETIKKFNYTTDYILIKASVAQEVRANGIPKVFARGRFDNFPPPTPTTFQVHSWKISPVHIKGMVCVFFFYTQPLYIISNLPAHLPIRVNRP